MQCLIPYVTQTGSNYEARRENIWAEINHKGDISSASFSTTFLEKKRPWSYFCAKQWAGYAASRELCAVMSNLTF